MNNQRERFPIIACFLALCFTAGVLYVLFEVLSLSEIPGGKERIVFSAINCLMLIGLASLGGTVRRLTTVATFIQLWCITVLYTVFQFGAVFIKIDNFHGKLYVLYQMIVLFLYLCVALPALSISHGKNNNQKEN